MKTSQQIRTQIIACEKKQFEIETEYSSPKRKLPSNYYSLLNKIKNLSKQLEDTKKFEYLAM